MSELSLEQLAANETPLTDEIVEGPVSAGPSPLLEKMQVILTAETGPGDISEYMEHPLNIRRNKGIAQILRGLTGIIGNLKLAIIDIGLGAFNVTSKGEHKNVNRVYNDYKGDGVN